MTQLKSFENDKARVDPVAVAGRDKDRYLIEVVLGIIPLQITSTIRKSSIIVGNVDPKITKEPWKNVRNNAIVHE